MNKNVQQKERTILFAGYTASEASAKLAKENEQQLKELYSADFVESAMHFPFSNEQILSAVSGLCRGDTRTFTTEKQGLLGALWEMSEYYSGGFSIDMFEIPLRQETVEICNFLDLDPFALPSKGCVVIVTDAPLHVREHLKKAGIPAAIAGTLQESRARILRIGEKVRYLDRPV